MPSLSLSQEIFHNNNFEVYTNVSKNVDNGTFNLVHNGIQSIVFIRVDRTIDTAIVDFIRFISLEFNKDGI